MPTTAAAAAASVVVSSVYYITAAAAAKGFIIITRVRVDLRSSSAEAVDVHYGVCHACFRREGSDSAAVACVKYGARLVEFSPTAWRAAIFYLKPSSPSVTGFYWAIRRVNTWR